MKQTSYVMVKPEFANNEKIINEVKKRLFSANLLILDQGYIRYDKQRAMAHYAEHVGKDFYPELENYITSDKAYGLKVCGEDAISKVRELVGATKDPKEGTIRYDIPKMLNIERRVTQNVVHASDSTQSAEKELAIFEELKNELTK